jgi:hypothetical protein
MVCSCLRDYVAARFFWPTGLRAKMPAPAVLQMLYSQNLALQSPAQRQEIGAGKIGKDLPALGCDMRYFSPKCALVAAITCL